MRSNILDTKNSNFYLKKIPCLIPDILSFSYRPISMLSLLAKLLDRMLSTSCFQVISSHSLKSPSREAALDFCSHQASSYFTNEKQLTQLIYLPQILTLLHHWLFLYQILTFPKSKHLSILRFSPLSLLYLNSLPRRFHETKCSLYQ